MCEQVPMRVNANGNTRLSTTTFTRQWGLQTVKVKVRHYRGSEVGEVTKKAVSALNHDPSPPFVSVSIKAMMHIIRQLFRAHPSISHPKSSMLFMPIHTNKYRLSWSNGDNALSAP
jgi:hypothetical protein